MALQVEGMTICPTPASWASQSAFDQLSVVYFEIHMYHSDNHSLKEYLTEWSTRIWPISSSFH